MARPRPAVVLVRPQEEGNVGAAARAMANMGLDRLVLVEPAVDLDKLAYAFAVGAGEILDSATRSPDLEAALRPFSRVIGTTSARARDVRPALIGPRELPVLLAEDPPDTQVALVFGPEVSGLSRDELALCSAAVRVPTSSRQPTLNLAQAVLILTYELFLTETPEPPESKSEPLATGAEIEGLFEQLVPFLARIGFDRDDTFAAVLRDLRQLAARSPLTSRDVQILRGICRRAEHAVIGSPPR